MKDDSINYDFIAKAQLFYRALGYRNIATPWMVTQGAIRATLPAHCRSIDSIFGSLVGSGEQGFIQMMLEGKLEPGRYQTTTPCFRDETEVTDLTLPYFMKLELISYQPADPRIDYEKLMNDAVACFFELSTQETFDLVHTSEGFDMMHHGIEIGSYGVRQMGEHVWVYATGLAEPRFSLALATPPNAAAADPTLSQDTKPESAQIPLPFPDTSPVQ